MLLGELVKRFIGIGLQPSGDRPRFDEGDPDAFRDHFLAQRLGEQRHPALGGVVHALPDRFDMNADRADENQVPVVTPPRADPFDSLLGAADIADEVGVDHLTPARVGDVHQRIRRQAGASHQHVQPAEFVIDEFEQAFEFLRPGKVAAEANDPFRVRRGRRNVRRHNPRAGREQARSRLAPHSSHAAGNQHPLSRQPSVRHRHLRVRRDNAASGLRLRCLRA